MMEDRLKAAITGIEKARAAARQTKTVIANTLNGSIICFTGRMKVSRAEAMELVVKLGGHAQNAISKETTLLVNANSKASGTMTLKLRKVIERGIPVITEEDFWNLITRITRAGKN